MLYNVAHAHPQAQRVVNTLDNLCIDEGYAPKNNRGKDNYICNKSFNLHKKNEAILLTRAIERSRSP